MGTEIIICAEISKNERAILQNIKKIFCDFEEQFSRFRATSELSRLNRSRGRKFNASAMMMELLEQAKIAHARTNGIFDPAVINILKDLGYDKNFEDLEQKSQNQYTPIKIFAPENNACLSGRQAFTGIKINKTAHTVKMPANTEIDLGGIGKGFVVDLAARKLKKYSQNFWISAGGDMIFSGTDGGKKWRVGVQNPLCHEDDIMELEIPENMPAIATSGITKRTWRKNGATYHHIIDPRTGLPANNGILAATVMALDALKADVLAKSALILGKEEGLDMINNTDNAEGVLIDRDLHVYFSKNMRALSQI